MQAAFPRRHRSPRSDPEINYRFWKSEEQPSQKGDTCLVQLVPIVPELPQHLVRESILDRRRETTAGNPKPSCLRHQLWGVGKQPGTPSSNDLDPSERATGLAIEGFGKVSGCQEPEM